jgi:hypothetical protein
MAADGNHYNGAHRAPPNASSAINTPIPGVAGYSNSPAGLPRAAPSLGFEVVDAHHASTAPIRDHCVYGLDGHPSRIAHGVLLETSPSPPARTA